MANEITISVNDTLVNGVLKDSNISGSIRISQALARASKQVIALPTAETDVAFAGITTHGYAHIQNMDPTNFISYGPKSGGAMIPFGKLKAGEIAVLRLTAGITLRMIADTAACNVHVQVWND